MRKESDASVGLAFGMKAQEVDVLGNEYAAAVRGILQVLLILRRDQIDVQGRSDVDAALPRSAPNETGDVLVDMVPDRFVQEVSFISLRRVASREECPCLAVAISWASALIWSRISTMWS